MEHYDVIVIGAGHAGVEAANISEKYGLKTALITKNLSDLGKLSCNPSVGGVGKTHIASEVDILGGVICKIGDKSAIHYRVLNLSKGPAVWGQTAGPFERFNTCLLYTSPSPRDRTRSRMPSSA